MLNIFGENVIGEDCRSKIIRNKKMWLFKNVDYEEKNYTFY